MKLHVLWPFAFGLVLMLTVNSCTKTVTGPTLVDSVIVRDTLRDTLGARQALVRFVSMFPGSPTPTIALSKTLDASSPFAYATNSVTGSYLPLRADTSYRFYLSSQDLPTWSDSMDIPPLGSTMKTYVLFLIRNGIDSTVYPAWSNDSEYLTPPPAGYCYLRFIDGIADGADTYYLDLDTIYNDLFSNSKPISNLDITRYVLLKAGVHTLLLRTSGSSITSLQTNPDNFGDGSYYTIRATGSFTANNAKLKIDQE